MLRVFAVATALLTAPLTHAEFHCQGFEPEALLVCRDGRHVDKVLAFEEQGCAKGRDGVLNDAIPIKDVDGPTWTSDEDLATVSFSLESGERATLKGCELL